MLVKVYKVSINYYPKKILKCCLSACQFRLISETAALISTEFALADSG